MEHMSTSDHTSGSHLYIVINTMLYAIAGIFTTIINTVSLKDVYNWIFGGLSIISVMLIIIINAPKAWKVLTGKDSNQTKNNKNENNDN
jgi:cell division protein FtsW (lipid II flippase)